MAQTESISQVTNPATAQARANTLGRDGRAYGVVAQAHQVDAGWDDDRPVSASREAWEEADRQADLAELAAMRALQIANRNKAYARRRPTRYANASYATLNEHQSKGGKIARWWASGPRALLLAGPARTGKTTAAYAIANDVHMQQSGWTMTWTAADLSAALKPDSDQPLAFEYATTCDLLLIDDLGRERVTDWWLEQLQRIVDTRCSNGRRMIVTTNCGTTADEMFDELVKRYGHPVVERLIDDGAVLIFDGPAVRRTVTEW
jgi:DNA replication protein DnaC